MKLPVLLIALVASSTPAADLKVTLPTNEIASIANAIERGSDVVKSGSVSGSVVSFMDLTSGAVYDLAIEEKSGVLLCGVDLNWCDATAADPQAEPLGDDDREAIRAIVQDIRGFANKPTIQMLQGTHERAVALVDLVRDNGFHSNKSDEVIWRAEVWFFKWQNGGWERVSNQSRLLRRERFASHADYEKETKRLRWVSELGGVKMSPGDGPQVITLGATTQSSR